jgi:hypothetical protein
VAVEESLAAFEPGLAEERVDVGASGLQFRHPTQHHAVAILVLDRTSLMVDSTENSDGSSESVGQASAVSPSFSPTSSRLDPPCHLHHAKHWFYH